MLREASQQHKLQVITLESLVPHNHPLRNLDKHIDFELICDGVRHLYCRNSGVLALELVMLFTMVFLG